MNPNDIEVHEREADNWWDPDSKMAILNSFNMPRFSYFSNFINNWQGLKVLDVGCGGGFTSEYLAKKGARVTGVDISAKLVEAAKAHAEIMSLDIDYQKGSAENMPYEDGIFDVVVCVDVLEHVSDLERVIAEIQRVLRDNGWFLFDTLNKTDEAKFVMISLMEDTLKAIPKGSHDWNKFVEPEILKTVLIKNGFNEIEIKGFEVKGRDDKTGQMIVEINTNLNVMYIGKAVLSA